jgi:hypothetical protein
MSNQCAHPRAVPVTLTDGEVVAALCPDCDERLPAAWIGCAHEASVEITVIGDPAPRYLCSHCQGIYSLMPV